MNKKVYELIMIYTIVVLFNEVMFLSWIFLDFYMMLQFVIISCITFIRVSLFIFYTINCAKTFPMHVQQL